MALFTWWRGDPLPALHELDGFRAAASDNAQLLAGLAGLNVSEARRRLRSHHRPYEVLIAMAQEEPLAPCWHCVIDARQSGAGDDAVTCWAPATAPEESERQVGSGCCGCG